MIHSSELHKISKGHSQERHFFLFDNQLIYCKKVSLWPPPLSLPFSISLSLTVQDAIGGRLSYKGRLSMEKCHITDLPDGQGMNNIPSKINTHTNIDYPEIHNGVPVRNAWKMDNEAKGKDYIIFAKSPEIKSKWMDAFRREQERVAQDRTTGQILYPPVVRYHPVVWYPPVVRYHPVVWYPLVVRYHPVVWYPLVDTTQWFGTP